MDSAQDIDLAPFFGDLSQSKKLSEIKPPLETTEEFLCQRNWASALKKTMEGERQHLSPHIGDFNDDSKIKRIRKSLF